MVESKNKIWKAYPEFTFIEANQQGDVRTRDRVVSNGKGTRVVKGRILKQQRDKYGYLFVGFSVNGKHVNRKVHRIVAKCFIPNPNNLPQVNHKNCDRTNNSIDNLEWVTLKENIAYRDKCGHTARNNAPKSPVYAVNLITLEVLWFESQMEASRSLGISEGNIYSVIKGRYKQTNGYWFTEDNGNGIEINKDKLRVIATSMSFRGGIFAINLKTLRVLWFPSQIEASRSLRINKGNIWGVINGRYKQSHGYWFVKYDVYAVDVAKNKLYNIMGDRIKDLTAGDSSDEVVNFVAKCLMQ